MGKILVARIIVYLDTDPQKGLVGKCDSIVGFDLSSVGR